jgi:hypothetical protein
MPSLDHPQGVRPRRGGIRVPAADRFVAEAGAVQAVDQVGAGFISHCRFKAPRRQ